MGRGASRGGRRVCAVRRGPRELTFTRTKSNRPWDAVGRRIWDAGDASMTPTIDIRRRDIVRSSLALAGLGLLGIPEWVLPALAQGETAVPFLDFPDRVVTNPAPDRRI